MLSHTGIHRSNANSQKNVLFCQKEQSCLVHGWLPGVVRSYCAVTIVLMHIAFRFQAVSSRLTVIITYQSNICTVITQLLIHEIKIYNQLSTQIDDT